MLNWQTIDNQMPQAYKTVILQLKEVDEPTIGFFDKKENKWELLDKNLTNFDKEDIPYTIVAWHQMPPQYKEDLDLNLPSAALAESLTKAQINKLLEYTDKEYSLLRQLKKNLDTLLEMQKIISQLEILLFVQKLLSI